MKTEAQILAIDANNAAAIASPTSPTTYTVTYPGRRDSDSDVGYGYLKRLAANGYEVQVGGVAFTPSHTIPASASK